MVLADAGPLYAAADRRDGLHPRAQRELERLRREQREVLILWPSLLECYTLVLHRLGLHVAMRWLGEVESGAGLICPTPEDFDDAIRLARRFGDQPLTLFDTTLAVVAQRLRLPVWTFDHHFAIVGATLWR